MARSPDSIAARQAEKDYLRRSGAAAWDRVKPFAPPGQNTVAEGLHLIQHFGAAVALLDPLPHHRILDLGAGGGWAADWLQRLGLSVTAVDLSYDLMAIGRERLAQSGPAHVVCGDAEALPFAAGSFDRVMCLNALHHVPDRPSALRELARILTPDGRVVFSEPGVGHSEQAHAQRAAQDFGVREEDVDPTTFLRQCRSAGFSHVTLEPFAQVIPGHGLTMEHWNTWGDLASASRPRRALRSLRNAALELAGARKEKELFVEAFSSEVLRVLRAAMTDHPIVVASKRPLNRFLTPSRHDGPALQASIRVLDAPSKVASDAPIRITIEVRNIGSSRWLTASDIRGHVSVGLQLLDANRRLMQRDYVRQSLPRDLGPEDTCTATIPCVAPNRPGQYFIKVDLVSEGVSWFEPLGSTSVVQPLDVGE